MKRLTVKKQIDNQKIDIWIDSLTNCLINSVTGEEVETEYRLVDYIITKQLAKQYIHEGWNFDWSMPQQKGCEVYELFVKGEDVPQGRLAFMHLKNEHFTYLELIESAPENVGHKGLYKGVGGHLFAIACKHSFDEGNDGYVQFEPKTKLIRHYQEAMGAIMISRTSMFFDTTAARRLVNRYFGK